MLNSVHTEEETFIDFRSTERDQLERDQSDQ